MRAYNCVVMYCIQCGYAIDHLPEDRCPECGTAFDPNDWRTWTHRPGHVRRSIPIAASFTGAFFGWALSYSLRMVSEVYISSHVSTGGEYWATSALLAGLWWILLVLPVLTVTWTLRVVSRPLVAVVAGCFYGAAGLWLLLGWGMVIRGDSMSRMLYLTGWAALVGATTGLFVARSLRPVWTRSAAPTPGGVLAAWWLTPVVCVALWLTLAWPGICRVLPNLAYRVGGSDTRRAVLLNILRRVQIGEPSTRLHELLPEHFGPPSKAIQDGSVGGSWDDWQFEVYFDHGHVTRIDF